jgi:hypothetical protein
VIPYSSNIVSITLKNSGGVMIGYDMRILNQSTSQSSSFVPPDNITASYITLELIQNLFDYYISNSSDWKNMKLN